VNVLVMLAGWMAAGVFAYLVYALIKPEQF